MEAPAAQRAQVQTQAAVHVGGYLLWKTEGKDRAWDGPTGLEVQGQATALEPSDGLVRVYQVDLDWAEPVGRFFLLLFFLGESHIHQQEVAVFPLHPRTQRCSPNPSPTGLEHRSDASGAEPHVDLSPLAE